MNKIQNTKINKDGESPDIRWEKLKLIKEILTINKMSFDSINQDNLDSLLKEETWVLKALIKQIKEIN
jgi:hypothetical protein